MKKFLAIALCLVMLLGLASCKSKEEKAMDALTDAFSSLAD